MNIFVEPVFVANQDRSSKHIEIIEITRTVLVANHDHSFQCIESIEIAKLQFSHRAFRY